MNAGAGCAAPRLAFDRRCLRHPQHPDYTLKVMQHGAQSGPPAWSPKAGIHATPLLSETMKFITVNPTWNVPPSIIYNEYLPALQQDPRCWSAWLELEHGRDGQIHISQPPGEANALGRVDSTSNKFLVYQHDTPDKYLSQGRSVPLAMLHAVQNPDQYASVLSTSPCERPLHAGEDPQHVRSSEIDLKFRPDPGQHHLPDRFRGRCASCRSAGTFTAATAP